MLLVTVSFSFSIFLQLFFKYTYVYVLENVPFLKHSRRVYTTSTRLRFNLLIKLIEPENRGNNHGALAIDRRCAV